MHRSIFSRLVRKTGIGVFSTLVFALASTAAGAGESQLYGSVSHFTWREFDDNGVQLLRESGPLYGVGYAYRSVNEDKLTFQWGAELFGGSVDYTGRTQGSATQASVPVSSTVGYYGVRLKIEGGSVMPVSGALSLEPFAGLGLWAWSRTINDATTAAGSVASGYEEVWKTMHARMGLRGFTEPGKGLRIFAEAGVKVPVYTDNSVQSITLHPGVQMSYFSEVGLLADKLRASLFYDGMRFARSEDVPSGGKIYHQPRSTSELIGFKLGSVF